MASGAEPYAPARPRVRGGGTWTWTAATLDRLERNSFVALAVSTLAALVLVRLPASLGGDAWLLLVSAREVLSDGLPREDTLTVWTAGEPWIDQQWAAQLGFYGVHALGGIDALLLANAALLVGSFAAALVFALRLGASARSAALVGLLGIPVLVPHAGVRAQTLAYPLFVVVFALLVDASRAASPRRALLALPLLVVWANVHGSVLAGAALVTLFALVEAVGRSRGRARASRPLLGVLAVAPWACVLASPYGLELVGYYRATVLNPAFAELVGEWGRSRLPAQAPFFLLAAGGTWLLARTSATPGFAQLAFAFGLVGGLLAVRNVVWFALVALVVLPRALDDAWPARARERRRRVNLVLAVAALAAVAAAFGAAAVSGGTLGSAYGEAPAQAVGSAIADSETRVFANERYADWLLWRFPELEGRVAFDARFELLEADELEAIARWRGRSGDDWRAAAQGYELLVLDLDGEWDVVRTLLAEDTAWPAYTDGRLILLVVRPGARLGR